MYILKQKNKDKLFKYVMYYNIELLLYVLFVIFPSMFVSLIHWNFKIRKHLLCTNPNSIPKG